MIVRRINNDELYHHGVKGQRWGHRKQRQLVGKKRGTAKVKTKKELTPEQKKDRKTTARVLGIAVATEAAIIGSAFAYDYIKKKRGKSMGSPEVKSAASAGKQFFESFKTDSFNYDSFSFNTFKYK